MALTPPPHLSWPFFDDVHRTLAAEAATWVAGQDVPRASTDEACRQWVHHIGAAGFLRYAVPKQWGGALERLDSRAICLLREAFAEHDGLADFSFAMQGLGSGAITMGGSDALRDAWLPRVAVGNVIGAFALSEPEAGSDAAALTTRAERMDGGWALHGTKTWISNGGIADFYCVFARSEPGSAGSKGISAFLVTADSPGVEIVERIEVLAPHPLATIRFAGCFVPEERLLGAAGAGFALAMRTLDIFRVSVAAAAVGFARRALRETLRHARDRAMFGATLGEQPLAQAIIGDMATDLDAAALLTYRAAWQRDTQEGRTTAVAAMAKLAATEYAQRIIDRAVQLHGGRGVRTGEVVERLYREIRSLRIYEGASEVQRLLVGREALKTVLAP